jgi:hypothetical protein
MMTNKIVELAAARAKMLKLESQVNRELAALPKKYGFANAQEFVAAVTAACGGPRRAGGAKAAGKGRRSRAVITDATRAEVKKLVEAGRTGAQIADAVGISLPSVHNIKKALGLVQKR